LSCTLNTHKNTPCLGLEPTAKCSRGAELALGFYSRSLHRLDCTICTALPVFSPDSKIHSLIEVSVQGEIKIAFEMISAALEIMFNFTLI
jgi:hypothetical protein